MEDYIGDNLGSDDIRVISQLLRLAPDNPSALARFGYLYLGNANFGSLSQRLQVARWYQNFSNACAKGIKTEDGQRLTQLIGQLDQAQGE